MVVPFALRKLNKGEKNWIIVLRFLKPSDQRIKWKNFGWGITNGGLIRNAFAPPGAGSLWEECNTANPCQIPLLQKHWELSLSLLRHPIQQNSSLKTLARMPPPGKWIYMPGILLEEREKNIKSPSEYQSHPQKSNRKMAVRVSNAANLGLEARMAPSTATLIGLFGPKKLQKKIWIF